MFDYNYWARDRQLKACKALSPEQFLRPMGSSFSSLRDTLAHLVAVEWVWQERWRGNSVGQRLEPLDHRLGLLRRHALGPKAIASAPHEHDSAVGRAAGEQVRGGG